jgi:hypothetical protein
MKTKTLKYIAIALGLVAILVSINALYNGNWILGFGGIAVCIFLIVLGLRVDAKEVKMPFPEIVNAYKDYMEVYFSVILPKDVDIYHNEETVENYIVVLAFENEDKMKYYFPFEANKFTGEFGRGAGVVLEDIREVEFWINKYDKTYRTSDEIAKSMGNHIAKKIREELEFYNKDSGGETDGEPRETTGGY